MTSTKKKLISFLIISVFVVLPVVNFTFVNQTLADEDLRDEQVGLEIIGSDAFGITGEPQDIRISIVKTINVALTFLGVIFIVLILLSGYQWMTSGGNDEQVSKAKKNITNAVAGLVIIMFSWGVSYWILRRMVAIAMNDINYLNPY